MCFTVNLVFVLGSMHARKNSEEFIHIFKLFVMHLCLFTFGSVLLLQDSICKMFFVQHKI